MKTLQEQVGEELRTLRMSHNLSQEEAGNKGGIDQRHISRAERGEIRNIALQTIERIAAIYGKKVKIEFV